MISPGPELGLAGLCASCDLPVVPCAEHEHCHVHARSGLHICSWAAAVAGIFREAA